MRILVLGGTVFLGRHLVSAALARGHELTLFNRGRTRPHLFPECERVTGDRDGGLGELGDLEFDVVLDTSGYLPRVVGDAARTLADRCERYVFVSSVSVYDGVAGEGVDETNAVATIQDESFEEITETSYGPLKALCERAVEAALPGRTLVVRPGLIVGPDDPTDRFTYWPARVAQGGRVLAPGDPAEPVQVIDVRDLAQWMIELSERRGTGVMNAVGPARPLTIEQLLETCVSVSGSDAELVWVDNRLLLEQGVEPWSDLPLWLGGDPAYRYMETASNARALAAGLRFRPLADTVAGTLEWHDANTVDSARAGFVMTREREQQLLDLATQQARR